MGYSENENSVRYDVFKPSGKWVQSLAIEMDSSAPITCKEAVESAFYFECETEFDGYTIVCLHPNHRNAQPILFIARFTAFAEFHTFTCGKEDSDGNVAMVDGPTNNLGKLKSRNNPEKGMVIFGHQQGVDEKIFVADDKGWYELVD